MSGPSTPNYITPVGLAALKDEYSSLKSQERPKVVAAVAFAAANGDRSENADYIYGKRRLREIDRRLRYLQKKLDAAEVVDPTKISSETIVFGATVTLEDEDGKSLVYKIVGEDEFDDKKGWISWKSPVAKAVLGKKIGDEVAINRPAGILYVEITDLKYE